MRNLLATTSFALVVALAACGDNLSVLGPIDAPAPIDSPTIDTGPPPDANCPVRPQGVIGGSCTTDTQCDTMPGAGDGFCLRGAQGTVVWPAGGYCISFANCDPMNPNSCGVGNTCVTIQDPTGAFNTCLPACGADPCVCPNGEICAHSFTGSAIAGGRTACLPGNASAADGAACTGFAECGEDSLCQGDAFEFPGGQCGTLGCAIGNDATCADVGDGHCVDLGSITSGLTSGTICVDACANDSDCRQAAGYKCFDGGGAIGKFCRHPKVGDACTADTDCGDAATWICSAAAGASLRFCSIRAACPTPGGGDGCPVSSSACWDGMTPPAANTCVDRCGGPVNTPGGCRAGFTCRDINPGAGTLLGCVP
jgi:hypothetical protein